MNECMNTAADVHTDGQKQRNRDKDKHGDREQATAFENIKELEEVSYFGLYVTLPLPDFTITVIIFASR